MQKISVVIPSYKRNDLLSHTLPFLLSQRGDFDLEVIILDESKLADKELVDTCETFGCVYIHTGYTKQNDNWRPPSFAINVGIKKSSGEFIAITCPEILLPFETTLNMMYCAIKDNHSLYALPSWGKDDTNRLILDSLERGCFDVSLQTKCIPLNRSLPFFVLLHRNQLFHLHGYDEDFLGGIAFDDNDFIDRLNVAGYTVIYVENMWILHLYHKRVAYNQDNAGAMWKKNKVLYEQRKGVVVRNRYQWGVLP
jgi:GT2 family glycosyltransferase